MATSEVLIVVGSIPEEVVAFLSNPSLVLSLAIYITEKKAKYEPPETNIIYNISASTRKISAVSDLFMY